MRRDAFLVVAVILSGCGYVGNPLPPAINVPLPVKDVRAAQVGDRMIVEFTQPIETTEGIKIKRLGGLDLRVAKKGDSIDAAIPVDAKLSDNGVVKLEVPVKDWVGQDVIIGVRTTNPKGRASAWSNLAELHVAAPPAVPTALKAESDPAGARLSWTGSSPAYRVFRRRPDDKDGAQIGEPTEASFKDETAEYDKKYVYWVVAVDGGARSAESALLEFTAVDKFAPEAPKGLTPIIGPVSVELAWESNTEADLRGYRVYRSLDGAAPERLAEVASPAFSDKKPVPGKKHVYTVTAIDKRENESAKSPAVEVDVP